MAMAMADVTVRGAGIFGLSIAWDCARRGARVQVVDPFGAGAGSSGGLTGALSPHVPENWNDKKAFQLDSLLMAEGFWAGVEAAGGVSPGYGRTGRLQPIADGAALDLARARTETARDLWRGQAEWRVIPAEQAARFVPISSTGWVIHDTLSARINPRRAVAALVAALAVHGVEILSEAPDRGAVIHATGVAGLKEVSRALCREVGNGVKGQSALIRFDAGRHVPQVFADGVHLIPHADGTLAIGSTSERDFDDPTTTDDQLEALIERATALMPALHGAPVITRWAGVRPRTKSRAPMLGEHPLHPGQFIANGGFKIGFGMAPNVAQAMADLVLEGRDSIPDGFGPQASL
jgi:glycine/D-amino acid oxidase-like deaminating enzyme